MSTFNERETFFKTIHDEMSTAAKKGWAALNFLVLLQKTSLVKYPIPDELPNLMKDGKVDKVSKQLYPDDAPPQLSPVQIYGDGNCLYRAMSVCLFGDEKHFKEMRVRVVFEIVTNIKRYINKETYNRMSENSVSLEYVFETSVSPECYVREDLNTSLRSEMIKSSKDGEYAGLLQIFAAVNAIHRPVYSIYPRANNPAVDRKSHNLCIVPFSNESSNLRDTVHVMWTHTSNTNMTAWSPNHFVACVAIPDSDSGDNFSSESTFEGASRYFDTAGGMDTSASRENLSSENTMGSSSKPQRPETLPKKKEAVY